MRQLDTPDSSAGTRPIKNELERSANLATKTRVNIEFYGHIDKILRRMN